MGSVFGINLKLSIFGEAHGAYVGGTMHGFPAGFKFNLDRIKLGLKLRQGLANFTSVRKEEDRPIIISGVSQGKTNGAPLTVLFANKDFKVQEFNKEVPRPSSADYASSIRYNNSADMNGGGHLGGRLTLPMVFFGMLTLDYLETRGICVASHVKCIGDTFDDILPDDIDKTTIDRLNSSPLATLNSESRKRMVSLLEGIKATGDSIGGIVESIVVGMPAGIGSPMFDNLESRISSILFAIPAVKGVSFGLGFDFAFARGSLVNDSFIFEKDKVRTASNNNGGLNRGITNGMPIRINTAFKPTPSISQPQKTLNIETNKIVDLKVKGDSVASLVPRANIVVTSAVAVVILDALLGSGGYSNI